MRTVLKLTAAAVVIAVFFVSSTIIGLWGLSRRPGYCGWCHVMEPYYRSWASSDYLARRHSLSSVTCQTCHPRSMGQLVHEVVSTLRGSYTEPLPVMQVTKENCMKSKCHGDYASLAKATASLKVNPHASHLGEEECFQCHKMHRSSPGLKFCMTCHHTGELVACRQCHKDR